MVETTIERFDSPTSAERDEQLAKIAHDLRGCLYTIGVAAELLEEVTAGARAKRCLDAIAKERKSAVELIDRLLDVAQAN